MSKRPAFQFYPGDWRTDPGLRLCSVGARGLWIEIMCLMHEGEPYGHLTVQGRHIGIDMLARLVGESASSVKRWYAELEINDVFSKTAEGMVFSRRMVRDEDIRNARALGGKEGASHGHKGASHGAKGGRPKNVETPLSADGRGVILPPPSSSSSSSSPSPEEGSVAKATGVPPSDADSKFWADAKSYLTGAGVKNAGAIVGKLVRDHGKPEAARLISRAQIERAVEPVAFIAACAKQTSRDAESVPLC
jgi:hypothetical protein